MLDLPLGLCNPGSNWWFVVVLYRGFGVHCMLQYAGKNLKYYTSPVEYNIILQLKC